MAPVDRTKLRGGGGAEQRRQRGVLMVPVDREPAARAPGPGGGVLMVPGDRTRLPAPGPAAAEVS